MPYKGPTEGDTRGWRPFSGSSQALRKVEPGARTGENRTPVRVTDYPAPAAGAHVAERGVPLDNAGSGVLNKGSDRELQYGKSLDFSGPAPSVPPSSFEGVPVDERGNTPDDVQSHDFAVRAPGRQKRPNSAIVGGASAELESGRVSGIGFETRAGARAVIPMSQDLRKDMFLGDGANPQSLEAKADDDEHHRKGVEPEMKGTIKKHQANFKRQDQKVS